MSPEAAHGGLIGLIENGDSITISVKNRLLTLNVPDDVIEQRRQEMLSREKPLTPRSRDRQVSKALRSYAKMATSADKGAVRLVD